MKRISNSKKTSAMLGIGLLVLAACAPDSLTRGGGSPSAPIERSNDNSAATNANANEAGAQTAPGVQSDIQPTADSASGSTLASPPPAPTAPSQNEIEFTGTVEVMASDTWVVGGRTIAVTSATEIKPGLAIGALAKVHAVRQADGTLWARQIEPSVADDDGNGNSNDNDNSNDNTNDDNGNGNVNSNDDGGNDNVNSNDDNGSDDNGNDANGNGNSNDDNGNGDNGNANADNGNDDDDSNSNGGGEDDDGNSNGNDD